MESHTFAICAYQDSHYLEACIRSLKKQTLPTRIILCTSTPSPYIWGLAGKYKIPVYVREGESDIQKDWNFAYHMADSTLVTIAHQDDMYHKTYVQAVQDCWSRYPDTTVMTTDAVMVKNGSLQRPGAVSRVKKLLRLPLRVPAWNHIRAVKMSALILGNPIMCPSCTYQKKILGEPLFTSSYQYALDWDTMVKLAGRQGRIVCIERPLLYYRIHGEATTSHCIHNHIREQEEEAMFRRFWPRWVVKMIMKHYRKAYNNYDE